MTDINQAIQNRVNVFVAELTELIQQAIRENIQNAVTQAFSGTSVTVTTHSAPAPRASSSSSASSTPRRGRPPGSSGGSKRTAAQLAEMAEALLDFVESKPGVSIEEIGRGIDIPTRELMLPVRKLLDAGALKKKGQKRATRYFIGRR